MIAMTNSGPPQFIVRLLSSLAQRSSSISRAVRSRGIGGDPLQHRDPLLEPADLALEPGILAGEQLDSPGLASSPPPAIRPAPATASR